MSFIWKYEIRRMRLTILLIAFGLIASGFGRPSEAAGNGEEYVVYEEKDSAPEEYLNDKEVEARSEIRDEDAPSHTAYKQSSNNNEYENLMEERTSMNKNDNPAQVEEEPLSDRRASNPRFDESEDEPVTNTRFNSFKRNQNNNEYRSGLNEGNTIESDRRIVKDKSEYNNEAMEAREEPLYKQITYYNKVQGDFFHKKNPKSVFNSNRDRREIIGNQQDSLGNKNEEKVENNNEDSITAIKRNIKKLSSEELEDLLNSLSDDKKALLNKIIGSKSANDNLNKREITKKAGALEENSCLENSHSELSKLESGSSMDSISSVSESETTETTKQSENGGSKTKIPESSDDTLSKSSESKDDLSEVNFNNNQESVQEVSDAVSAETKDGVGKETINKRETEFQDGSPEKSELTEDYDLYKDDNWSELMKDETELHKSSNLNKRHVDDYSNTAAVKSLEESFPCEAESSKSSNSQMAPLIRVKRTNSKRAGRNPGNMKVPFFPAAVNDEDDVEKDEFDDGSNLENSYNYEKVGKGEIHGKDFGSYADYMPNKNMVGVRSKSKFKSEIDSAKIGSDTDNVLSNGEGVDDNLMYKNDLRIKRAADDVNMNNVQLESREISPEGSVDENDNLVPKNNLARYQEQDTFGSMPRPADEEVGRYKRIRRFKQPVQENILKA